MMLLKKIYLLPTKSKKLAASLIFYYVLYFLLLLIIPFEHFSGKIRKKRKAIRTNYTHNELKKIWFLKIAVSKVNQQFPFKFRCLVQVLAISKILRKNGIPHTVFLGLKKTNHKLVAHAWLNCGNINISGGMGHKYKIVGNFEYVP